MALLSEEVVFDMLLSVPLAACWNGAAMLLSRTDAGVMEG